MQLTHHAYYIEGPLSGFAAHAAALKPFWAKEYERFGIDEARALIQLASLKNTGRALYFVGAASITSEAQQALLKLFEEPQEGTTFVLLLPHGMLLPTLRSRMLVHPEQKHSAKQNSLVEAKPTRGLFGGQSAGAFLKASPTERSAMVTKLLKDEEGVRERSREFVNALEAELYRALPKNPALRSALEDVARVRSYLGDRSPSLKMLLEHLAVTLPSRL